MVTRFINSGQLAKQPTWEVKNQRELENQVTSHLNPGDRGEKTEPSVRFGFHLKANSLQDNV